MSKPKRARAENWTREERDILLEIVKNYRHIVDNQATNTNTVKLKNIVWNRINTRFHEISNTRRNVKQLKTYWKRLKHEARKKARSQINGISTSDNEKMSNFEDSSLDEATNSYDNDDSMFEQVSNRSEVVLLVEPSHDSNLKTGSHILDEELNEEEICSETFKTERSPLKYESSRDYDVTLQSRLQNRENVKKRKARCLEENASQHSDKREVNYAYKEFMLKRFYLRLYHKNEIKHQHEKHRLEIENLLLERKKIELEIELFKKKHDIIDK